MDRDAPLQLEIKPDSVGGHEITRLKISGAVDASSVDLFQVAIGEWLKERPKELVLDFGGLTFLNSAAASLLGTFKSEFEQVGIDFVIVHVSEAITAVLTLIGLHEVIPLLSNDTELAEFMKSGPPGQRTFNRHQDAGAAELSDTLKPEDATVLMVTPRVDRFAEVTKLRLSTPRSKFEFVFNCEEAREMFRRLDPDLVIIEDQCLRLRKIRLLPAFRIGNQVREETGELPDTKPF